ncbi:myosin heavy chain, cardiac muscle isoform-like [Ptychodera flava]|uniref:myosin heavy chain, cardiac muscle isoform-like n=1 Tax=Ptychodera flava TaxID=63121 RepID=UPI00396A1966
MTTRVQEIVIENNEMYANLQRTDECHRKDIDQLELLKDENCKLQDEIADLATESKKLISQLQLAKDELSNELSDVMKHMKLKEEKAEFLEKETVEYKAKFDECQKNSKHLEMKLSYYKEADVEMFRLKTKNKRLVTALAVTAKEKQRLVCKIEQLERLVEEKQQNRGPGQCV